MDLHVKKNNYDQVLNINKNQGNSNYDMIEIKNNNNNNNNNNSKLIEHLHFNNIEEQTKEKHNVFNANDVSEVNTNITCNVKENEESKNNIDSSLYLSINRCVNNDFSKKEDYYKDVNDNISHILDHTIANKSSVEKDCLAFDNKKDVINKMINMNSNICYMNNKDNYHVDKKDIYNKIYNDNNYKNLNSLNHINDEKKTSNISNDNIIRERSVDYEHEKKNESCNYKESINYNKIQFEKKKKKSYEEKKEREKELLVAYWLNGIVALLKRGFKNGNISGSNSVGKKIAEVLKKIVEIYQWKNVFDLIEIIKYLGKQIIKNNKMFFVIPNIIRRVLTIIRMEHFKQLYLYNNNYMDNMNMVDHKVYKENQEIKGPNHCENNNNINNKYDINNNNNNNNNISDKNKVKKKNTTPITKQGSNNIVTFDINTNTLYQREIKNFQKSFSFYFEKKCNESTYKIPATNTLKHSIIEGIEELMAEIDTSWEEAEQRTSYDLFTENDVILTLGYSAGVEKFLKTINKKKDGISVIVVGGDINRNGFKMSQSLSDDGVDTTYISDAAVFAVIPKVTKVLLGSVAVSSTGGAITKIGAYNIACSAQLHSKPIIIVLPLFKLIYVPLYDPLKQNELQPGPSVIYNDEHVENLHVRIPKYDYIPEHLITLYITEMGPVDSFQLYNITKKRYHPDDMDLSFD
ncbi:eukaryotic translation initiation factor 2b, subunit 2, putative [Plasmodium sp. DRC-Itaito]|nr:eukaryotic translation initiation factor 2b, subunit 2, putative [Plasmodium sp. DRC-Itaito]